MLPTLMPAIASCSPRLSVIVRGRYSREVANRVASERKTLGPRVRGDDGSPSQSVGLFAAVRYWYRLRMSLCRVLDHCTGSHWPSFTIMGTSARLPMWCLVENVRGVATGPTR